MKRALIVIDIQNDFLPGGSLAVPDGDAVVPVVNRLIDEGGFDLVVATQDWHPAGHRSFASSHPGKEVFSEVPTEWGTQTLWPDHCVQGTAGAEFAPGIREERFDHVVQKGTDPGIDSYSGFFDNARRKETELASILRANDIEHVTIAGLATDYCVKFTATDAIDLGFDVAVVEDACRGVGLADGDIERASTEMREAGCEVTGRNVVGEDGSTGVSSAAQNPAR